MGSSEVPFQTWVPFKWTLKRFIIILLNVRGAIITTMSLRKFTQLNLRS